MLDNVAADIWTRDGGAAAQALADAMSSALIGFARGGDPNTPSLPSWPRYLLRERP